jgi:hypothetical protein
MKKFFRKKVVLLLTILFAGYLGYCVWYTATGQDAKKAAKVAVTQAMTCNIDASQLLGLINAERAKLGAPQLVIDPSLAVSAKDKMDDMTTNQYFGHNKLDGTSPESFMTAHGVKAAWSEDVGFGDMNADSYWQSFRESPSHYSSLTSPKYTRVGIASSCTGFDIKKVTGPEDNNDVLGDHAASLAVVHLAAPEPVNTYYQPRHTSCISNPYTGLTVCN